MNPELTQKEGQKLFTAYNETQVFVNNRPYSENIIVLPTQVIVGWTSASFETLGVIDLEFLASLESDIILLGTGNCQRFPRPELLQPLIKKQKGMEVMTKEAACRTFNLLASEGRNVVAALLVS